MTMDMTMGTTKRIAKNLVKAKLLEYFRYVEETGEEIIVTDHGRPAVRICPMRASGTVEETFSAFRGKVVIQGDPLASVDGEWEIA
jgi:prevent-host-death family protein